MGRKAFRTEQTSASYVQLKSAQLGGYCTRGQ